MADRYARQRIFAPLGDEGQQRLAEARVSVVGIGALGSLEASYLVRAGVGWVRLHDRDFVELDNLQRQVLYDEEDVRAVLPKAEAAARKLRRVNSEVTVEPRVEDVNAGNVERIVSECDVVVDGTDNFETRMRLNDACVQSGKPWVYAGCVGAEGMAMAIRPGVTPCFRCLVPALPAPGSMPTCDTAGVLNAAVGVVASVAVGEALKLLAGRAEALLAGLFHCDLWSGAFHVLRVPRAEECAACGQRRFEFLAATAGSHATTLCGRNAVQVAPAESMALDLEEVERRIARGARVSRSPFLLRVEVEGHVLTLFPDGRAIVQGTDDPARARSIYARYVGN